jgi:DNA-binding transcriptional MocR family regulator
LRALRQAASEYRTGFQPGPVFSNRGGFANCLRLSFAHYVEADIAEGVQRLSRVLHG